jgi:hypothetical protein
MLSKAHSGICKHATQHDSTTPRLYIYIGCLYNSEIQEYYPEISQDSIAWRIVRLVEVHGVLHMGWGRFLAGNIQYCEGLGWIKRDLLGTVYVEEC